MPAVPLPVLEADLTDAFSHVRVRPQTMALRSLVPQQSCAPHPLLSVSKVFSMFEHVSTKSQKRLRVFRDLVYPPAVPTSQHSRGTSGVRQSRSRRASCELTHPIASLAHRWSAGGAGLRDFVSKEISFEDSLSYRRMLDGLRSSFPQRRYSESLT